MPYTVKHILAPGHDSCPLVSQERSDILHNYSLAHIFSNRSPPPLQDDGWAP